MRKPTFEQEQRFKDFCALLANDIRLSAYRASLQAGYTQRMAKSKSYKLAQRAWKLPAFRKARHRTADAYAEKANREYFLKRGRRPDTLEIIRMNSSV